MPRITLSYRRSDAAGITGRIFDRLARHFGENSVFMDVDTIPLGVDFRHYIDGALKETDFLLVVIGSQWLGPRTDAVNRIADRNDPVRVEVAAALKNDVTTVIPLLIDDTPMPTSAVLPDELEQLSYLQAAAISSGKDFSTHIARVISFIDATAQTREQQHREAEAKQREDERRAGDAQKIERKHGAGQKARARRVVAFDRARSRRQMIYVIVIVIAILVAIFLLAMHA